MGNQQATLGGKLSKKDLERLQRRFLRLARGRDRLEITEFEAMVELGGNPFVPMLFRMFDSKGDNTLSLEEFTQALEYFGTLEDPDAQYQFAFRLYDQDKDGLISSQELFNVLRSVLGSAYPEAQLEQVVENTMAEFDRDGDSCLNLAEFMALLSATDLTNKFRLSL